MTAQEALEVDYTWRDVVIAGSKEKIDRLLGEIDRLLSSVGWERDTAAEQKPLMRGSHLAGSRCYTRHTNGHDVRLWLLRRSDVRLDGGLVESTNGTRPIEDIAESILDFRQHVLEPAVQTCGLTISRNSLGPLSLVTAPVVDALWAFYDSAEFQWPLTHEALRRWREFVISAHQNRAAFDTEELKRWLTEKGWDIAFAEQLIGQLFADAALLSEYDELHQLA